MLTRSLARRAFGVTLIAIDLGEISPLEDLHRPRGRALFTLFAAILCLYNGFFEPHPTNLRHALLREAGFCGFALAIPSLVIHKDGGVIDRDPIEVAAEAAAPDGFVAFENYNESDIEAHESAGLRAIAA